MCKPVKFISYFFFSNRIHRLKYCRSTTLGCKNIGIKIQSLSQSLNFFVSFFKLCIIFDPCANNHLKVYLTEQKHFTRNFHFYFPVFNCLQRKEIKINLSDSAVIFLTSQTTFLASCKT